MNFSHWWLLLFYTFCGITLIQLFYYLFFFSRLVFYKKKPVKVSQTHPVSVIVCARDEAANLAKNLPGILVQEYRTTHEVIVVDDNSFDESRYLLEQLQKTYRQLQVVELKQEAQLIPGKKFPLSIGIKTAKYEILLLTDADCVPATKHWIDCMQAAYDEQTEIVLGYGPYNKKRGFLNILIRWETVHTALQYFSYALAGIPYMGVGRNLSYRRNIFFRHKGFSTHNRIQSGDDDLFINMAATRNNVRINLEPDSFTLSDPPRSFVQWYRQKSRHYSTGKYYKPLHKFLLGMYSFSHFCFYPLFVLSLLFFDRRWTLLVFGIRFMIQAPWLFFSLKKLKEKGLFGWFLLFDIWMFFYYLLFSIVFIKKPRPSWKIF